jgi:hypothetical protein
LGTEETEEAWQALTLAGPSEYQPVSATQIQRAAQAMAGHEVIGVIAPPEQAAELQALGLPFALALGMQTSTRILSSK